MVSPTATLGLASTKIIQGGLLIYGIGLILQYYRRLIPNFSKWAKTLHMLIVPSAHQVKAQRADEEVKLTKFVWTPECH